MPQKNLPLPDETLDIIERIDIPIIVFILIAGVAVAGWVVLRWIAGAML